MCTHTRGFLVLTAVTYLTACNTQTAYSQFEQEEYFEITSYEFPSEEEAHEGTWLTWSHHYTFGKVSKNSI